MKMKGEQTMDEVRKTMGGEGGREVEEKGIFSPLKVSGTGGDALFLRPLDKKLNLKQTQVVLARIPEPLFFLAPFSFQEPFSDFYFNS